MPNRVHGLYGTYLSSTLRSIRRRCNAPAHKSYKYYGAKGIKCLIKSPQEILDAIGHRPSPDHTIDRIDRKGSYTIGNIRWATKQAQAENSGNAWNITHQGQTKTLAAWAREIGITDNSLKYRLKSWGVEKALTTPISQRHKHAGQQQCDGQSLPSASHSDAA